MAWGPFPAYPVFASSSQAVSLTQWTDDAPLAAGGAREGPGVGFPRVEAGDGVDDLLADEGAVGVVAVAAAPTCTGVRLVGQEAHPLRHSGSAATVNA
jgi:hypothetical protein